MMHVFEGRGKGEGEEEKKGVRKKKGRTVRSRPGETEFTRIFGPTIVARDLTRWIWAAFVTEYACVWGIHQYRFHQVIVCFALRDRKRKGCLWRKTVNKQWALRDGDSQVVNSPIRASTTVL